MLNKRKMLEKDFKIQIWILYVSSCVKKIILTKTLLTTKVLEISNKKRTEKCVQ